MPPTAANALSPRAAYGSQPQHDGATKFGYLAQARTGTRVGQVTERGYCASAVSIRNAVTGLFRISAFTESL